MKEKRKNQKKHRETLTYKLNDVQGDPGSQGRGAQKRSYNPFTLPMRKLGWFPDGIAAPWHKVQRLFPEEGIGMDFTGPWPFGVQFCESSSALPSCECGENVKKGSRVPEKTTYRQQWMLGDRLYEPDTPEQARQAGRMARTKENMSCLMCLTCDLARRIRKYNASLYRLRRLHYWFKFSRSPADVNDCRHFPPANPGDHIKYKTLPDPNLEPDKFKNLVRDAEDDWVRVTDDLSDFLNTAIDCYVDEKKRKLCLLIADMVEVNGYVVSMRVVARKWRPSGGEGTDEMGGSSSHVSISSAFSSY